MPSVSRRPETTRRAPSRAKAMAVARPMPVRAPVIKTTGLSMASLLEQFQASQVLWPVSELLRMDARGGFKFRFRSRLCKLGSHTFQAWVDHGIAASALLRRRRRGGKPDGCGRAAAAHVAALAQPANPRSGVRGRGRPADPRRAGGRADGGGAGPFRSCAA